MVEKRVQMLMSLGIPRKIAAKMQPDRSEKGRIEFRAEGDREAELLLYEFIGYDWWSDSGMDGKRFSEELAALGDIDKLKVRINSPGGDVWDGMSIYNQLAAFDAEVNVVVEGIAASAASLIAMAGDTVEAFEVSQVMIHDAWTVVLGNEQELREMADLLAKIDGQLASTYAGKSGIKSAEEFREIMDKDTYLTAQEAMELGLIDGIISTTEKKPESKQTRARANKNRIAIAMAQL